MKPRLLMLTHRFPFPPNRGDRIRSYNLLRTLVDHYRVTLGCTTDETIRDDDFSHIDELCEAVRVVPLSRPLRLLRAMRSFAVGGSLTEGMFAAPQLMRQVERWQREAPFDAVLVFCSSMFPYIDRPAFHGTRTVIDLVDVDSQKWRQMSYESPLLKRSLYRLEASRVQKLERRIARQADAVALVSDSEAELFCKTITFPNRLRETPLSIHGISNGVDTAYFQPAGQQTVDAPAYDRISLCHTALGRDASSPLETSAQGHGQCEASPSASNTATEADRRPAVPLKLVFTGVLDYSPNVEGIDWFCRQVFPQLRAEREIELEIVGRRPSARVLALDALDSVEVVGEVPDVRPYLQRADIAISPLQLARGIQNKVLEAMASGLPVVVTSQSAEGIDARSGEQFVIADTVDEWHEAITGLAGDPSARAAIGSAARRLVVAEYSWPARLGQFVPLLSGTLH